MAIAGIEQLQLRHDAHGPHAHRHLADVGGRVDHDLPARVHGVQIERTDFGAQQFDMFDPLLRRHQGRPRTSHLRIFLRGNEPSAWPRGQIDDQLWIARADATHHIAIKINSHRGTAGFGIAHMDVGDRSARLGGLECAVGDLLRRNGQIRRLIRPRQISGDRAGDDDLLVGWVCHLTMPFAVEFNVLKRWNSVTGARRRAASTD